MSLYKKTQWEKLFLEKTSKSTACMSFPEAAVFYQVIKKGNFYLTYINFGIQKFKPFSLILSSMELTLTVVTFRLIELNKPASKQLS